MTNIHYIVTTYLGNRRTRTVNDPVTYTTEHLDFLAKHLVDVQKVSIVVNADDLREFRIIKKAAESYRPYYTELEIVPRKNIDFSYGGWNHVIENDIRAGKEYSHYILLEDDYRPDHPDFIDFFLDKMENADVDQHIQPFLKPTSSPKVGYVCGMVSYRISPHAAISYGMLRGEAARDAYKEYGNVFFLTNTRFDYGMGETNQIRFLDYIKSLGYTLTDVRDTCSIPFLDNPAAKTGIVLKEWGTPGKPQIIVPIYEADALFTNGMYVHLDTFGKDMEVGVD